jgi:hypothetical protein
MCELKSYGQSIDRPVITDPSLPSHVAREHADAVWHKGEFPRIRLNSTTVLVLKMRVFIVCDAVL